jgi:anti-sigma B factor antagonist
VLESPLEAFRTSGREGTIGEVNALGEGSVRLPEPATINVQRFVTGKNVIHVRGGLCGDAVPALHRIIAEELSRFPALLTLQLSGVASIDGAGIDALVRASSLAGESDISLCLTGVRGGPVVAALVAAGVTELFEIFESVADAWEHVR